MIERDFQPPAEQMIREQAAYQAAHDAITPETDRELIDYWIKHGAEGTPDDVMNNRPRGANYRRRR